MSNAHQATEQKRNARIVELLKITGTEMYQIHDIYCKDCLACSRFITRDRPVGHEDNCPVAELEELLKEAVEDDALKTETM
jgi:hypothetical protein